MKRILTLMIALLTGLPAFCQHIVTGTVKDNSGAAVPFATLRFFPGNNPAQLETGKIADLSGAFTVSLKNTGSYIVKVSALGYKDTSMEFTVAALPTTVKVDMNKSANYLSAITVTASSNPPIIERKIDRIVMNVSNNPLATGKSSLGLLSLAPGVFVNDGEIFINGVPGTRIMVNGRMLNLSGGDLTNYLQNLRASDIQSIEIIAHPPAEYDAEGSGGIINIILKENTQNGLNGYFGADYSQGLGKYPGYNPYVSLNFNRNKLGLNASYFFNRSNSYQNITQSRNLANNGQYTSISDMLLHSKSNYVRLGATYDINSKQYMAFDYTGDYGHHWDTTNSPTNILYPKMENNLYSKGGFSDNSKVGYSDFGMNYDLTTDTLGSKFSFIADYTLNKRQEQSGTFSHGYNFNDSLISDTSFYFYYPSTAKILTANAEYDKKFKSNTQLSFGGKATITNINNNNSYNIFNNNKWQDELGLSFSYDYHENIYAGFINLSGTALKTEYKIGIRGENSMVNGMLTGGGQDTTIHQKYFDLFPDVFLKRNTDTTGNNFFTFSYNRRITRPSYFDLNPYKFYIDNYSIVVGNPYLKPQFTSSFELGYTLHQKYYFSLAYTKTKDIINQVIENDPNTKLMTILRKNTGSNTIYSATFDIPIQIMNWWNTSNNLLLTYTKAVAPEFNISKASFLFQTEQDFTITPTFSTSLNIFYTPSVLQGNMISGRMAEVDWGVQKKFFHKRITAKAAISDIFYTNNFRVTSYYNQAKIVIVQKKQTRELSLSLTYNFSFGKHFKSKSIKNSNSEVKSRLQ